MVQLTEPGPPRTPEDDEGSQTLFFQNQTKFVNSWNYSQYNARNQKLGILLPLSFFLEQIGILPHSNLSYNVGPPLYLGVIPGFVPLFRGGFGGHEIWLVLHGRLMSS